MRDSRPQSPRHGLARCTRLAQSFGEFDADARLLEYDFGDWEMQAWDDIDQTLLDSWMQDFVNQRPPNGETVIEMRARVDEFLERAHNVFRLRTAMAHRSVRPASPLRQGRLARHNRSSATTCDGPEHVDQPPAVLLASPRQSAP